MTPDSNPRPAALHLELNHRLDHQFAPANQRLCPSPCPASPAGGTPDGPKAPAMVTVWAVAADGAEVGGAKVAEQGGRFDDAEQAAGGAEQDVVADGCPAARDQAGRAKSTRELAPGMRLLSQPSLGMMDAARRESTLTITSP
jgi:hypothetical protein